MNRNAQDMADFVRVTAPLEKPNHAFISERQLARRYLGESGEDRLRRLLDRFADMMNGPLVIMSGRKLTLTPLGCASRAAFKRLLDLRNREPETDSVEDLAVAVECGVPTALLAGLTSDFLGEFPGLVRLRFITHDPETIRERIAAGEIAFAVTVDMDAPDAEPIHGANLAWRILARRDHALAKRTSPITPTDLRDGLQVAVPPPASRAAAIGELLSQLHLANRIEVPSREVAIQVAATGVAVALDLEFITQAPPENELLRRLEIDGLAPVKLATLLPRNPEARLSEPAKYLVERLRSAVRETSLPPIPPPPPSDDASSAVLDLFPEPLPA
jgi:hypothetical protein